MKLHVLIVEDSEDDAILLERVLTNGGYTPVTQRVDTAADMHQALQSGAPAQGNPSWDVVIADYTMPGFSGLNALSLLREYDPDIPIIIVSGTIGEDIAVNAMRAGAQDYMMKDNLMRLVPAVERELRESESRRERRRAEKALFETITTLKELNFIVNKSPACAFLWRPAEGWPVEFVSDNIIQFGYTPDEFMSGSRLYQSIIHGDDVAHFTSRISLYSEERRPEFFQKYRVITKSGKIRWIDNWTWVRRDSQSGAITNFQGIILDVTEREMAAEQLQASLKEKEVMLREIHHRVNNNLQIILSLLNLQARHIEDSSLQRLFYESRNRTRVMALIHEKLYRTKDLAVIDFGRCLTDIVSNLFSSYGRSGITFSINSDDMHISIDRAIPCAMIVNELVSNALIHAFPEGRQGNISIQIKKPDNETAVITVNDNGRGLPDRSDLNEPRSLGLQLVKSLTEQLEASIELESENETTFIITHKLN